jgi:diguanylate cyclase (GGDEF)-like protein
MSTTQSDNACLLDKIEAQLMSPQSNLRFDPELEARLEAETGAARNRQIYIAGLMALITFNIFLFNDYVTRPQIFDSAVLIRLVFVTIPCFLIIFTVSRGVKPWQREVLTAYGFVIVSLGATAINWGTESAYATFDAFTFVIIIVTGNIALPMRFFTALTATLATFMILAAGVMAHDYIPADAKQAALLVYAAGSVMTLVANFRFEIAERKSFLLFLRESLRNENMSRANEQLVQMSRTDPLTGLSNRRDFDEKLQMLMEQCVITDQPLSLLIIDIDHFKPYNDAFGHPAGDACLKTVAQAVMAEIRNGQGFAARLGGEEFAVVLPGLGIEAAAGMAERLRASVHRKKIAHDGVDGRAHITVSMGAASLNPDYPEDAVSLIARADGALYRAKRTGRDRAEVDLAAAA